MRTEPFLGQREKHARNQFARKVRSWWMWEFVNEGNERNLWASAGLALACLSVHVVHK